MLPPRAYIFIGLNAIRALSVVALILVFSSSIFVMVEDIKAVNRFMSASSKSGNSTSTDSMLDCDYIEGSTVPNQPAGVFWAVLNRLLIIFQVIFLILSEVGWPYKFFDKYFPVLGSNFGVGALGTFQCLIGAAVLSHHVDDFSLVSAFFLFALGCLNILVGLIFREKSKDKRSITSWRDSKKELLPTASSIGGAVFSQVIPAPARPLFTTVAPSFRSQANSMASRFSGHDGEDEKASVLSERPGYGWGSAGEKAAAKLGMGISRPLEALPPYGKGPRSIVNMSAAGDHEDAIPTGPTFASSGDSGI